MSEQPTQSEFNIFWTWSSPKKGWLCTIVRSSGLVRQVRQYSPTVEAAANDLGHLKGDRARRIYDLAAAVFDSEKAGSPAEAADNPQSATEAVELELFDEKGERSIRVPVAELDQHPAMVRVRQAMIKARNQIRGWPFLWYNVGGRLGVIFVLLLGFNFYLMLSGRLALNKMEREAQRIVATVTERRGTNGFDKNKYVTVSLIPANGSTAHEVKISKYMSAANWDAAKPGSSVRVWYDPKSGNASLEDDILRNIHDQHGFSFMSNGLALPFTLVMVPLIWFFSRYRAGTHLDGKEYLIRGDRVVPDGKALPFTDRQLLVLRGLIRLAEK
jgi:hypothetical protein